jgi:hypothetical protein
VRACFRTCGLLVRAALASPNPEVPHAPRIHAVAASAPGADLRQTVERRLSGSDLSAARAAMLREVRLTMLAAFLAHKQRSGCDRCSKARHA